MISTLVPLKLLKYGYPAIPSDGGNSGKAPLVNWAEYQTSYPTEEELSEWQRKLNPSLWGIVTGHVSEVVIVDIDDPSKKILFDNVGLIPHIQTPRGGYHYWFRHPGTPIKTCTAILPGIDVRADGGFVNVIGRRKDGEYKTLFVPNPDNVYPWDKIPPEIADAIIVNNNGHSKQTLPSTNMELSIPEGQRNDTLTREAGKLRRAALAESTIYAALTDINNTRCNQPLPENEIASIAKSVCRYFPGNPLTIPMANVSENVSILTSDSFSELKRNENVTKSITEDGLESNSVTGGSRSCLISPLRSAAAIAWCRKWAV